MKITDDMIHAALETEYEGSTVRGLLNAQLWHYGAYGNAKAVVRRALIAAMEKAPEPAPKRGWLAEAVRRAGMA